MSMMVFPQCDGCGLCFSGFAVRNTDHGMFIMRNQTLKKAGWSCNSGKDYCPACVQKKNERAKHAN